MHTFVPMIKQDIENKGDTIGVTVLEPNGDLTSKIYEIVLNHNKEIQDAKNAGTYTKEKYGEQKTLVWFNPTLEDCPYFNPLEGDDDDAINVVTEVILRLNTDSPQFFKNMASILIGNAIRIAKGLYGDDATLLDVQAIICNHNNIGLNQYVLPFKEIMSNPNGLNLTEYELSYNRDVINWFLKDYYSDTTKTFENMAGVQKQIQKIMDNDDLRKVLNPPRKDEESYEKYLDFQNKCKAKGIPYKLNFLEAFENGYIVLVNTARNSYMHLGFFLGHLFVQTLEAAVMMRMNVYKNRIPNMLYIDDFPAYANWNLCDVLRTSESSHVAVHLSTQSLAQLGTGINSATKEFVDMVVHYTGNKIIYPHIAYADVQHFEREFQVKANDILVDLKRGQIMYRIQDKTGVAYHE